MDAYQELGGKSATRVFIDVYLRDAPLMDKATEEDDAEFAKRWLRTKRGYFPRDDEDPFQLLFVHVISASQKNTENFTEIGKKINGHALRVVDEYLARKDAPPAQVPGDAPPKAPKRGRGAAAPPVVPPPQAELFVIGADESRSRRVFLGLRAFCISAGAPMNGAGTAEEKVRVLGEITPSVIQTFVNGPAGEFLLYLNKRDYPLTNIMASFTGPLCLAHAERAHRDVQKLEELMVVDPVSARPRLQLAILLRNKALAKAIREI